MALALTPRALRTDIPALFFGGAALLTLVVSVPATFSMLRPFHDDGGWVGWFLSLFAMVVFEIGAVGAKLITIPIPAWKGRLTALTLCLLLLTTAGNYLHAAELFRAATLPPTLHAIRDAGHGWALVLGSAALFPSLLFIWLFAFTARVEMLGIIHRREYGVTCREQELAGKEQALAALELDLSSRLAALIEREHAPKRIEQIEYVRVATAELTWNQFEQIIKKLTNNSAPSLSTIRRLVSSAEQEVSHGAE